MKTTNPMIMETDKMEIYMAETNNLKLPSNFNHLQ